MPVNALIARGYQGGIANEMYEGRAQRERSDALANMDARRNMLAQREDAEYQREATDHQSRQHFEGKWAELQAVKRAPPEVQARWYAEQSRLPGFANTPFANLPPEQALPMMEAGLAAKLGIDLEQTQDPGPLEVQQFPGYGAVLTQGGVYKGSRAEPAPQQYGPESFSTELDNQGNILLVGNRGTIRETGRKGQPKASAGSGVTVGPDGQLIVDTSKASEGERVSAGYLGRMRGAAEKIESPTFADYAPTMPKFMAFASLLDDETGVMGASAANWVLDDADRAYMGQALDFILAKMRKESGATIKGGEFRKEYINYFPMPDDSPQIKADKARKRQLAMRQLEISAGRAEPASYRTPETKADLPPVAALKQLEEGKVTTFANGQSWTVQNGKYVQVK